VPLQYFILRKELELGRVSRIVDSFCSQAKRLQFLFDGLRPLGTCRCCRAVPNSFKDCPLIHVHRIISNFSAASPMVPATSSQKLYFDGCIGFVIRNIRLFHKDLVYVRLCVCQVRTVHPSKLPVDASCVSIFLYSYVLAIGSRDREVDS
jgi:hypothetical protein